MNDLDANAAYLTASSPLAKREIVECSHHCKIEMIEKNAFLINKQYINTVRILHFSKAKYVVSYQHAGARRQ